MFRNEIRSNRGQAGVWVHTGGLGICRSNEIHHNACPGVRVQTRADPTFSDNRIFGNEAEGVIIDHEGLGVLNNNEVFENHGHGVNVAMGANPLMRRNDIHHHTHGSGINLQVGAAGVFENNRVYQAGKEAVLQHDKLSGQKGESIVLHENEVKDNIFGGSTKWVVSSRDQGLKASAKPARVLETSSYGTALPTRRGAPAVATPGTLSVPN
jgi:hypothetical protein